MDSIYSFLSLEITQALSWTLVHSLWQGLLIACILSLLLKYSHTLSPRIKSLIALGAFMSLLAASFVTFFYYYDFQIEGTGSEPILLGNWEEVSTYLSTENIEASKGISLVLNEYGQIIVFGWFFGFMLSICNIAFGLQKLIRLKSQLIPLPVSWQNRLSKLAIKLKYEGNIILGESKNISTPLTFGFIKPVILFPVGMINQLSFLEVEAIMAHELAHIIRKDYLINFIHTLLEGVYYFNPGAWIISNIIRVQREHCCDDIAISITGNSVQYLKALVAIEESKSDINLAMAFSRKKKPLLQRVQRILKQPQKNSNMKEKIIMTSMFLIGLLLFTLDVRSTETPSEEEQEIFKTEIINQETVAAANTKEEPLYSTKTSEETNAALSILSSPLTDTIPIEDSEIEYLDEEEMYLDVSKFEELMDESNVKIIIEDGDISEMTIDGKELSEEEISKIQYNLSDKERDELKENADIIIIKHDDIDFGNEVFDTERRREMARMKAEIRKEKEQIKRGIRKNAEKLKREKEYAKREIIKEKHNLRRTLEEAKKDARKAIENARSYSSFDIDDIDFDFEDFGDEIAMDLEEVFEDLNLDLVDLNEVIVIEMEEFHEGLADEMEDLHEELAEMQEYLHDNLEDLSTDIYDSDYLSTEELINALESKLLADGLIDDRGKYSFLLKKKKFQINGKDMSSSIRNEYETFFEDMTDNEWSDKSKLKIIRKGNSNYSEFILKN